MSNCCSHSSSQLLIKDCPKCDQSSKSVEMRTLFHQLKFPKNIEIISDNYYFCTNKACSVGYFSQPDKIIPLQHLRSFEDIKTDQLCYCFDINKTTYLTALSDQSAESLKNFIIQKTKSGDCACEIKNPSGQCCLAKFKQLEKSLQ